MPATSDGRRWQLAAILIALPALLPLVAIGASFAAADPGIWSHLRQHVLPQVLANTLWLLLGVGLGAGVLGTALAALVALFEFPGRRVFAWALLLPLALPGYVMATAAIGLFDWGGTLATTLRGLGLALPEVRSRGGAIVVMTLTLYPYVYLLAREAFASQGRRAMEAARSLGLSPRQALLRAALPLARPWIAGATLLVLMETLADFGTVAAFNYDTFTTAIYKAWYALFSIDTALQIASVLLLFVLALLALDARTRAQRRYTAVGSAPGGRIALSGAGRALAPLACSAVLLLGFLLPAGRLLADAWRHRADLDPKLLQLAGNAVLLGVAAAVLVTAVALLLAGCARARPGLVTAAATRVATLGYALPGALLAVALYVPLARAIGAANDAFGWALSPQGGLALLLLALAVRFLAVAHVPAAAGLERLRPALLESARLLGVRGPRALAQVYLPLLRGALGTAALLVFVDTMKEMPITLMTRPFGWDTLATRVFELTSEGEYARAALPALAIVAAGLVPVWLLNRGASHG